MTAIKPAIDSLPALSGAAETATTGAPAESGTDPELVETKPFSEHLLLAASVPPESILTPSGEAAEVAGPVLPGSTPPVAAGFLAGNPLPSTAAQQGPLVGPDQALLKESSSAVRQPVVSQAPTLDGSTSANTSQPSELPAPVGSQGPEVSDELFPGGPGQRNVSSPAGVVPASVTGPTQEAAPIPQSTAELLPAPVAGAAESPGRAGTVTTLPGADVLDVRSRNFGDAFSSQVSWMAGNGLRHASLRLNPPELGLVEVRIAMNQGDTTISFVAQHDAVKEAIESALPKLRQSLAQSGLSLGDVNVSSQSSGHGEDADTRQLADRQESASGGLESEEHDPESSNTVRASVHRGLIDKYV